MHSYLVAVRLVFTVLFFVVLFAGLYLIRNHERFFGVDPNLPSENEGARSYTVFQIFAIWAHALVLTGAFALCLH